MTTSWHQTTIGKLGRVLTGKTPSTKCTELFDIEYPFITPTDIEEGRRGVRTERFISESGRRGQKNLLLPPKAVCFTCIASIGKICMTSAPSFTNQQINSIIADSNFYDPEFIYYLLRHNADRIRRRASGSATPILNKTAFSEIEVTVPDLPAQRKIATVLSAYDNLIENNTRRIKILEDMAQMLYREWFVHFRFPGYEQSKTVEAAIGLIPEGWSVQRLAQILM